MAKLLPDDFREFLKLCNRKRVKYLVIGGYAVSFYGYPRATADMDIWVESSPANADRIVAVLKEYGYRVKALDKGLFLKPHQVVRMGYPPLRLANLTTISGVAFADCFAARRRAIVDGIRVNFIDLDDLKTNKRASGRPKDLDDLDHLLD